ncbi:MAG: GNAT family N-acetyltransferase [Acidobacteria bacterium]|nr:GNAT family N-acetyltransferase [Acidobacteriota bacterium]
MGMMRYDAAFDDATLDTDGSPALPAFGTPEPEPAGQRTASDWRQRLPVLCGQGVTLREVQVEDATALFPQLTTEEVARFISRPPSSVAAFEGFIRWSQAQRAAGRYACFAVVPAGQTTPVGLFQIRIVDAARRLAEGGVAFASVSWGTGLFEAAARLVVEFAFTEMGMRRIEARAAVPNLRGNGALRKLGAVREALLHQSFERHGERFDQVLWTILRDDWHVLRAVPRTTVH